MSMDWQWRAGLAAVAFAGLAACQPPVPDSGAGVGFGDYAEYQRQREAQLTGQTAQSLPPASAISSEPLATTETAAPVQTAAADSPEAIAAQTRAALDAAAKFKYKPRVVNGEPVEVAGVQNRITFEISG